MKKNVSALDAILRLILGAIALFFSLSEYFHDDLLEYCLLALGALLIVTGLLRVCPLYLFLGLDTHNKGNHMKMY